MGFYVKQERGPDVDRAKLIVKAYVHGNITMSEAWTELCTLYQLKKKRYPGGWRGHRCGLDGKFYQVKFHQTYEELLQCELASWGEEGADHLIVFHFPHYAFVSFSGDQKDCVKECDRLNALGKKRGDEYQVRYEY